MRKYKDMTLPAKMAFWFLICSMLQKGIGMISTPIFTRIMTENEYGRYSVYLSWYNIIAVFVTLSISGNCFTREIVVLDDNVKKYKLASSLYSLVLTIILVAMALYFIFRDLINRITGLTPYLVIMMMTDLLLITACQLWTNIKRVEYDYKPIIYLTLGYSILRPLFAIIGVLHVPTDIQVEARVTGIAIANTILFTWIIISIFSKGKTFFNKNNWKYALTFCIPLIPHYLSKTILNESDRIMIGHYVGNSEAGYYSVAYTIAGIMTIFNSAVAQSLDPWIYRSIKNRTLGRIGPVSYKISIAIALMNFFVMAIAPEVIKILAPSNFSNAIWVIPPVTASVFFTFMYDLFASFQFYYKKTNWVALGSCGGAVLNIVLNAIFIPVFGYVAAGYTTLICYVIFGILHYVFMVKVCKENLDGYRVYDWRVIFGIGFALVLLASIMFALYQNTVVRYVTLALLLCALFVNKGRIINVIRTVKEE